MIHKREIDKRKQATHYATYKQYKKMSISQRIKMHIKILIRIDFSDVTLAKIKHDNIQSRQWWWRMWTVIN